MKTIKMTNKRRSIMPSVISVLGIFFMLVIFMGCDSEKKMMKNHVDLIGMHENNSTVADYISYVAANNTMVPDHQYINKALVKLADATNAMAMETKYTVMGDLNMAKMDANKITQDPNETTHSDNIRKSADILADILHNLQMAKYPGLSSQTTELKNIAASIKPDILTDKQKEAIMFFFTKSARLLEMMN
ncbi:MAG: hypothetical protein M3004_03135, partial [Bacteroidota bacterium]|nr:hypothetical protein [Bacteroidota bacterium]